jgi:hypothetical protein
MIFLLQSKDLLQVLRIRQCCADRNGGLGFIQGKNGTELSDGAFYNFRILAAFAWQILARTSLFNGAASIN